jgi:hypothetical protein
MKSILKVTLFCFFITLLLFSCKSDKVHAPDVSNVKVDWKLMRYEQDLFKVDTNNMQASHTALKAKYPVFNYLYFKSVLPLTEDTTKLHAAIKGFLKDKDIIRLKDTTQLLFGDMQDFRTEMDYAYKYLKHYFPKARIGNVYTYISEFGYQRFIFNDGDKDAIGLGLDMFLGASYPYKNIDPTNPSFSAYLTRTFTKEHMVPKAVELIVDDMLRDIHNEKLIDFMINNGKKLYIMQKLLPYTNDSLIHEYNAKQMKWVKENELEIWSFFRDKNLMFDTDLMKINKYINPSPDAPGMPKEAPGKTANYIGLKIVQAYMDKYPQTSLQHLIEMKDTQKILELSKYKPSRF